MSYTPNNNPYIAGDPYSYDLKWIVDKLKEAIDLYSPLNTKFDNLYDYVHDYFDNLDLTAEVQAIIDQMEADGFFDTLVTQIVNDSGTIETTVTNWLVDNVTPVGSAVVVDSSLTIAGAAADAKKTGDELNNITNNRRNYNTFKNNYNIINNYNIEDGYFYNSSGVKTANANFKLVKITNPFTGSTQRLYYIDANHGAGTYSPLVGLDVSDNVVFNGYSDADYYRVTNNVASGIFNIPANAVTLVITTAATADINDHYLSDRGSYKAIAPITESPNANNSLLDSRYISDNNSPFNSGTNKAITSTGKAGTQVIYHAYLNSSGSFVNTNDISMTFPLPTSELKSITAEPTIFTSNAVLLNADLSFSRTVKINNACGSDFYEPFVSFILSDTYDCDISISFDSFKYIHTPFEGLNGVAFGTSITQRANTTGGYLQYLTGAAKTSIKNEGLGSSKIYGGSGATDMFDKITTYDFVNNPADYAIIEGFVNDFYNSSPLGTPADVTNISACGALYLALKYVLNNCGYAILILDHYGQGITAPDVVVNGLTQFDYYETLAEVAERMGVPVIKLYKISGMNEFTPNYFIDNIHPSAEGAKHTAKCIAANMAALSK